MAGSDDTLMGEIPVRYSKLSRLGAGGVGIVFKALDSYLNKDVAIKMLLVPAMGSEIVARFQREAKMASSLNHANIITVLDFGVTERGKPYMVMEYVEGKTLDVIIAERQSLTLDEALPLFVQICAGIEHAHMRGILHRDLKPSNVILTNMENEIPVVKILDFGLAKTQEVSKETLTKAGTVLGSPLYMSPEQAQSNEIDRSSDIYSIGVLMFETLTGSVPIKGDTAMETLALKTYTPAPLLDDDRFPAELSEIVDRCLQIDPNKRFESVQAVEDALIQVSEKMHETQHSESQSNSTTLPAVPHQKSKKQSWLSPLVLVVLFIGLTCVMVSRITTQTPAMKVSKRIVLMSSILDDDSSTTGPSSTDGSLELSQDSHLDSNSKLSSVNPEDAEMMVYRKNAIKPGVAFDEAKKSCRYDERDGSFEKIKKLRSFLNSGKSCYLVYNELRHLYLGVHDRYRSMQFSDLAFRNNPCDPYTLNCVDEWNYSKGNYQASLELLTSIVNTYSTLRYLREACLVRCGEDSWKLHDTKKARGFFNRTQFEAPDDRYSKIVDRYSEMLDKDIRKQRTRLLTPQ